MQFITVREWEQLLQDVENFDMADYLRRTEIMRNQPGYIEWFKSRTQAVQDAFLALPFEKFYTDKATQTAVYRIYGVIENKDGSVAYHAVSARVGWTHDVIDGIPAENLVQLDRWNDNHLEKIRMNNRPRLFLLPNGWVQASLNH